MFHLFPMFVDSLNDSSGLVRKGTMGDSNWNSYTTGKGAEADV